MSHRKPVPPAAVAPVSPGHPPAVDDAAREQQMRELGLSSETRRFLHDLHVAEKQLNDAFEVGHQSGELEQRIIRVYREMYGAG